MKKRMMVVSVAVLLIAGMSQATLITSISGAYVDTNYDSSLQILSLCDTVELVIFKGNQSSIENVSINFTASLLQDKSSGGKAEGVFGNGVFLICDENNTELIYGHVQA